MLLNGTTLKNKVLAKDLPMKLEAKSNMQQRTLMQYQFGMTKLDALYLKPFLDMAHFVIDEDNRTILIVAVYHTSLNPNQWKNR